MSHTKKGAKSPGYEMWGKRGGRGEPVANGAEGWNAGAAAKKVGIKTERARLKEALREAVRNQVQEQGDADYDAHLREYDYPLDDE